MNGIPGLIAWLPVLLCWPCPGGAAQAGTDIWVAALEVRDGRVQVGTPENVTRRPGYDNQPHFTAAGDAILYTRIGGDGQAEIVRYALSSGESRVVTRTAESEYSPTPLPAGGGFSVIRVEADSTQRLWRFDERGGSPSVLLEDVAPVGYHAWADSVTVVMFILGSPATLQVADVRNGRSRIVAENIGRSIQRIPGTGTVSFVQRVSRTETRIEAFDPASGAVRPLATARAGGEFHAWTPGGILLMAEGTKLFQWTADGDWLEVADFSVQGLRLSRLAVSPDGNRIALVADEGA